MRGPLELPGHPLIDSLIRFYIGKAVRKPPEQLWLTHNARPGKSREAKVDGNLWRVESFQSARWYGQRLEFDRTTQ